MAGAQARSAESAQADKLIALVRAEGCGLGELNPRLDVAVRRLVAESAARGVSVVRPSKLVSAEQVNGRPSPFAAVLDVRAARPALPRLAAIVRRSLGPRCRVDAYAVLERRVADEPRDWPLGWPSPGVKVVMTAIKRPDISRQAFDAHWSGPHAAVAMANPVKPWRYTQNLVTAPLGAGAPPLDGIGEQNFLDPNFAEQRRQLGAAAAKGAEDARSFQDLSNSEVFLGEEVIVKD